MSPQPTSIIAQQSAFPNQPFAKPQFVPTAMNPRLAKANSHRNRQKRGTASSYDGTTSRKVKSKATTSRAAETMLQESELASRRMTSPDPMPSNLQKLHQNQKQQDEMGTMADLPVMMTQAYANVSPI